MLSPLVALSMCWISTLITFLVDKGQDTASVLITQPNLAGMKRSSISPFLAENFTGSLLLADVKFPILGVDSLSTLSPSC
jgi:hypothetical protein